MRNYLFFFVFLIFSSTAYTQTIPEELQKLGFTQHTLVDYHKESTTEYFTFSDWTTEQAGDTITFVVENGKVIEKFKEEKKKVLDRDV
jgi:hypothetical protein